MEVIRHASNRWEVRGELPKWRMKGVETYTRMFTTKKAAEYDARRWRRHIVTFSMDMGDERFERVAIVREYLTERATN